MRKLLLFPAIVLSFFSAMAGQGEEPNVTSLPPIGGIFPHFNPSLATGQGVPANLRLIAKSYSVYKDIGFVPADSSTYSYGYNRGSVPNPDNANNDDHILFDVSYTYKFNASTWGYENEKQRIQYYTGNKVNELLYKKWHQLSSSWKNAERYIYMYDNNGKMQSSLLQLWYGTLWTNSMNSTLNYDNNNNVVQMNSTTYVVDFVYDGNNNLVRIEDRVWVQGAGWSNSERKNYTYNGVDVSEFMLEKWVNGAWSKSQKWAYIYDADTNVILSTEYAWNGNTWVETLQNEYKYDNKHNKLQHIKSKWDAANGIFVKNKLEERTYNSKSLPETVVTYTWNGQGWVHATGDEYIRYYYEQYDPTSVNAIDAPSVLSVHPLPASDHINISLKWDNPRAFTVSLTDMWGRVMYYKDEQPSAIYNQSLETGNMPAGNYILSVSSSSGNTSRSIVVTH